MRTVSKHVGNHNTCKPNSCDLMAEKKVLVVLRYGAPCRGWRNISYVNPCRGMGNNGILLFDDIAEKKLVYNKGHFCANITIYIMSVV